ncbi:MAG: AraC family transcriptional regulator [Opitutaceae bacterium]
MPAPGSKPPEFISQQVTAARRFYLNLKPSARRHLSVVCGGWEECSTDYAIDRASFPFFGMKFVANGRGKLTLAGRHHDLEPGMVFTYGPGIAQRMRTSSEQRLGKYFVDFTGEGALRLLRSHQLTPGTAVGLSSTIEVRQAFETLVHLAGKNDRHTERAATLQLELLLIVIGRSAQPGTPSERRTQANFERCRQYLDTHFLTLHTIEEVAVACHLDVSYLCRLFRHFHGETPYRYLQRLQMQWAALRLHTSDRLVRQVADELGVDPFTFSRMFKRIHGVSPSAFLNTRG